MQIIVNGEATELPAETLAEALDQLELGDAKVATALNGDFVPARLRATTTIQEGDKLEIVAPRQGG